MTETKSKSGGIGEILSVGLVLFAITFAAALLLGIVNDMTKDRIAELDAETTRNAMQNVLPSADTFSEITVSGDPTILSVSEGTAGGKTVGWCVTSSPSGFGGAVKLMVGIGEDHKVTGVVIISHSETPGLGARADDPAFLGQYEAQAGPLTVVKTTPSADGEIEALSGATVTSRAVTSGVQAALDCVASLS